MYPYHGVTYYVCALNTGVFPIHVGALNTNVFQFQMLGLVQLFSYSVYFHSKYQCTCIAIHVNYPPL